MKIENKILSGKDVASFHLEQLHTQIENLKKQGITPGLHVVLVGEDPASQVYTRNKAKKCKQLGMNGELSVLSENTNTEELCEFISNLNVNKDIHGILVQLPLPKHIDVQKVLHSISPEKDVDGFHSLNVGKLQKMTDDVLIPCTARGVIEILKYYEIETQGKHAVIIGRSEIVGRPVAALLSAKHKHGNASVTMCHSASKDISFFTQHADIIICAIGRPHYLSADMVKENAVVIDVGINRVDAPELEKKYKLVGDVDFENVYKKVAAITPVPGGVGPMTIAMLMSNTVQAAKNQNNV